jgi:hypothetical protein
MVACIGTGTGPLLLAVGRPGVLMTFNLVAFVPYAAGVVIAAPHGLTAVCVTVVGVKLLSLLALLAVIERYVGISVVETLRNDVVPAGVAGLASLAVSWPLTRALAGELPTAVVLTIAAAGGLALYGGVLRLLFPDTFRDLRLLFARALPHRSRRASPGVPERLAN